MSVAIFFSASVSLAKLVEPSVRVCVDVTVCRPLMTTIRLSWVRLGRLRLRDVLKFGFPVMVVRAAQLRKQWLKFVAF